MPVTTTDIPGTDAPEPESKPAKSKPAAKSGLADAMTSTDPLVQKLMWDRGAQLDSGVTDFANVAPNHNDQRIAAIDAELRKLGFDV